MTGALRLGIVIPVHDEEELLGACLDAVSGAVREAPGDVEVAVVVVLDACTDGSAEIAARFPFTLVRTSDRRVGAARRAGVARVRDELGGPDPASLWIACTDADSVVPVDWIRRHAHAARGGADVLLGPVRPDFRGWSAAHVAHWHETHPPGVPTGNVHGANLGIRGSVYDAAGGFEPVPEHEDARLVARARALEAVIATSADGVVQTSARSVGRTPGGYAGFVRGQAERFAGV